uniref:Frizzled-4 n=1 Tax=Panagrellus redivivus TaxID=6233 RepID=A0A7E4W7L5_PANRE
MVSVCFTVICLVAAVVRGSPFNASRPLDRSLFYCTLCFAFSASLYAISLLFKDSIACIEYNDDLLYAGRGLPNTLCTFIATLLYYFGSAGRLWWLMLSVAWRWNMKEHSVAEMEKFVFRSHIICWALPLFLVVMALMAQSIHPELLSGVCLVGTASQANHQVFVVLREFLITLAAVLVLIGGCLTTVQRRSDVTGSGSATPSAGFIGVLYPIAAIFLLLSSLQNQFTPLLGKWTTLAALQLLADPSLGTLIGAAYFVYLLYACYQHGPIGPGLHEKQGYLPAMVGAQTTTSCVTPSVYHQVSPQGRMIASLTAGGTSANGTYYAQATGDSPPQVPQIPIPPVPSM